VAGMPGMNTAGRLLLGLVVVAAAPACATKKDVKGLRDEMILMQVHQDSLFRNVQLQNRLLLDTLRTSFMIQQDAAGQTSHRFQQLEQQLQRTEELMYQMQTLVSDVIDRLDRQEAIVTRQPMMNMTVPLDSAGGGTGQVMVSSAIAGEAAEAYDAGMEKMSQNAPGTARAAFEIVVNQFPNHPLASLAQYQIGETYAAEGNAAMAIEAFEKVEARWPGTERAPTALLRAGILSEESGNRAEARRFYETIERRYPAKEEAREAKRRLGGQLG